MSNMHTDPQQKQVFLLLPHKKTLIEVPEEDPLLRSKAKSPGNKGAWVRNANMWRYNQPKVSTIPADVTM